MRRATAADDPDVNSSGTKAGHILEPLEKEAQNRGGIKT